MRRLLFLSRWFPYPATNGSKLRIYGMLRRLSEQYAITLLSFTDQPGVQPDPGPLLGICEVVHAVPYRLFNPGSPQAQLGFFSPRPRSVIDTYSRAMEEQVTATLASRHYDLIIASEIDMAVYSRAFSGVPSVLEDLEVAVLHDQYVSATSWPQRVRYGLTWAKYRRYLSRLLPDFALCTVVSEQERELLSQAVSAPTPITVVPNCIELHEYTGFHSEPEPASLIFTGSLTYAPNYEAMHWFLSDVWPLVRAEVPEARLTITGAAGDRALPTADGVIHVGFVPDVRPLVAGSWASLAPIHQGGGTRLKILEAMALGTPVVATTKGAEGLDVVDGEHLLLGDSPEAFAAALIRLLQSPELRARLADKARQRAADRYDWAKTMPRLLALLDDIVRREMVQAAVMDLVPEG
jgi:polysaccharide biosynthesis protein PslH